MPDQASRGQRGGASTSHRRSGVPDDRRDGRVADPAREPRGRDDYRMRSRAVEPVFGQIKTCQNLTMMSRRGFTACESEWLLSCTAHNLRKLYRHRAEPDRQRPIPSGQHLRPPKDRSLALFICIPRFSTRPLARFARHADSCRMSRPTSGRCRGGPALRRADHSCAHTHRRLSMPE
jgi:hypothetical protein